MKFRHFVLSVFIFSAALALSFGFVSAQEDSDLLAPGLTPESRFYFLDQMADWMRLNAFTFNPVRKAEVKVKIAEERLSELNNLSGKKVKQEILEKLEEAVAKRAEEAGRDAENLDAQNQNVSRLVERLSDFNLKRQRVLENVLERVPEEARDKVETALNNVYQKAEKNRELLLKQKEKGFVSEEKAREIVENQISKLKEQLEKRIEKLPELQDSELKTRLEKVLEEKIKILEDEVLAIESKEDLKQVREKIKEVRDSAIESTINLRKVLKKPATTTEEQLKKIKENRFDVKAEAEKLIRKTEEKIFDLRIKIQELKTQNISVPQKIEESLENTLKHLEKAKTAFKEEKYGEAFGQATSGFSMIDNLEKFLLGLKKEVLEKKSKKEKKTESE